MTKTCYFCQYFRGVGKVFCLYANAIDDACTPDISTRPFTPTEEWLEYERLLKENEQMNKIIDYYDGKPVKDVFLSDGKAYVWEIPSGVNK